jgi:D-3-phosphoglycerate dehydrogenase
MGMVRPTILCLWDLSFGPRVLDPLSACADIVTAPASKDTLVSLLPDCDVYLASLAVQLEREAIESATRLKLIATPSTGLDHLDIAAVKAQNIDLISLKTEFGLLNKITATAEMTWALLLAAVRSIPAAAQAAKGGDWARDRFRGSQLAYKTLGILGVGRLGSMVAEYGKAFRMRVIGCDRSPRDLVPGVEYVDFDRLLHESDVISLHVHATPDNSRVLDAEAFAKMKQGVVLVNTSRGSIIDEQALLVALQSGRVAAAGLDVIDGEWRNDLISHPLIQWARRHENVVITPHLGGVTFESQYITHQFIAHRVIDWIESRRAQSEAQPSEAVAVK